MVAAESFCLEKDGLYYSASRGALEGDSFKVSSPIRVLGKMRNTDGTGWARLVELVTPDGRNKKLDIAMKGSVLFLVRSNGMIELCLQSYQRL